ncbi:MAG: TIM barrel protein [Gemmatimonadota bacterium]
MRLLFNTIMLEPNRWSADRTLTWPLAELLAPIRRTGFEELEIWQFHISSLAPAQVAELASRLAGAGLGAAALGAYPVLHPEGVEWDAMRDQLERLVEYGARLGIDALKIFPGRVASAEADAGTWARSVARLRWLAGLASQAGALLTMETHGRTLCDTLESTHRLLGELADLDGVGLCYQPYTEDDTDAAMAAFEALRCRVLHLHLQNRSQRDRATALLADGDWIDYRRFLPHVRARGFDGLACLEFTAGITPPDGEAYDPQRVLDNAARDRAFVLETWSAA